MKKILSLVLCTILLLASVLPLTACFGGDTTDPNEIAASSAVPFSTDGQIALTYNADGRVLSLAAADHAGRATGLATVTYSYGADGTLSSASVVNGTEREALTPVITDGVLTSAKGAIFSVLFTLGEDGKVIEEKWYKNEKHEATVCYGEEGKLTFIKTFEDEAEFQSASYTYSDSKISMHMNQREETIDCDFTMNAEGRPTAMTGTGSGEDGTAYTLSGTFTYGLEWRYDIRISDGASFDTRCEYVYTFSADGPRTRETVTQEVYANQKLADKTVIKTSYDLYGTRTDRAESLYDENGVVLKSTTTLLYNDLGAVIGERKNAYNAVGKTIHFVEVLYDGDKTSAIKTYFYDENGTETGHEIDLYTYNVSGECTKREVTTYGTEGKATKKTVYEYDIFGNVLTREEIIFTYIFGVTGENYKKYDGDGNLIDEGFRKSDS